MLARLRQLLAPEPRWVWPAVFTVEAHGQLRALLVYRQWVEMFWAAHTVIPMGDATTALAPAFWYPPPGLEPAYHIHNAWTGAQRETFPAGVAWPDGERAERIICLRSLHPMRGRPATTLRDQRRAWRPVLEARPDVVARALRYSRSRAARGSSSGSDAGETASAVEDSPGWGGLNAGRGNVR